MAARGGHEAEEHLQEQDGDAAADERHPGGPAARSDKRHHARQPATGRRNGRAPCERRVGVGGPTEPFAEAMADEED